MTVTLKRTHNLAYIVGLLLGDGSVYKRKDGRYCVELECTDRTLVEDFNKRVCKLLRKEKLSSIFVRQRSWGTVAYRVRVNSERLYKFIKNPSQVSTYALKHPEAFIIGFFKAEGDVIHYSQNRARVKFTNTDETLLRLCKNVLEVLGYHPNLRGPYKQGGFGKKPIYHLCLDRRSEVESFLKLEGDETARHY